MVDNSLSTLHYLADFTTSKCYKCVSEDNVRVISRHINEFDIKLQRFGRVAKRVGQFAFPASCAGLTVPS